MAGETTALAATELDPPFQAAEGLFVVPFTKAFATTQLELNDVMEVGYVPADCTVLGFFIKETDMDSNVSPTLAQKLTLGSTDLVTSITYGQTGSDGFRACVPTAITAKTKLTMTNTAAAATAVAGTAYIGVLCQR